jgi:hypothetical protein
MYKYILILFLIIGIMLIITDLIKINYECNDRIIYRYIPRTLEEEQNEMAYPSEIFKAMFTAPTAWVGEINDIDLNRKNAVNLFMASGN